jgi:hypothetical protein
MILDRMATFFEKDEPLVLATAKPSKPVNVPALAGRLDDIHWYLKVSGAVAASKTGSVTVVVQEADDKTFTSPSTVDTIVIPLAVGANSIMKFLDLPRTLTKEFVRLSATAASTDTAMAATIEAGISMDVLEPYVAGQYRRDGEVIA